MVYPYLILTSVFDHVKEKQDQGHDDAVNDPIALHLGDRVITPEEYNETYNYQWPTMRQMRRVR